MKLQTLKTSLLLGLGVFLTSSVMAAVINFDNLTNGTTLTGQYPEAIFSTTAGGANLVYTHASAVSGSNILCTGSAAGVIDCLRDTYIDFTSPVNGLTFWAIEPNATGVDAQFRSFRTTLLPRRWI